MERWLRAGSASQGALSDLDTKRKGRSQEEEGAQVSREAVKAGKEKES